MRQREIKPPTSSDYYFFVHHFIATLILVTCILISVLPRDEPSRLNNNNNNSNNKYHKILQFLLDLLPDRRWLIWSECLGLMGMMFAYVGLNLYREDIMSPSLDDFRYITDGSSNLEISINEPSNKYLHEQTIGVVDLPIMDVCQILYGAN
ncbi:phosphatidylinositol N-acetylglucosaminyltransferase GPI19 PWA37_001766 [Arxiozyma heterogenica]|uniref:phosphatidylinositol N-acetylglucosaminyltransferase GPI19 n=1 Tax=Arxiozyma heterogenica TaxID=278026 RepID=UPI002EF629BF